MFLWDKCRRYYYISWTHVIAEDEKIAMETENTECLVSALLPKQIAEKIIEIQKVFVVTRHRKVFIPKKSILW